MAKEKLSYWQRRAIEDEKIINDGAKRIEKTIVKAYRQAQEYLTQKAKNLFKRAQVRSELSEVEVKKLLNENVPVEELVELRRLAKDVSNLDLKKEAEKRLNALAFKDRISRAEDLKAKSYLVSKQIADVQLNTSTDYFIEAIHKQYRREQANLDIQRFEKMGVKLELWDRHEWEDAKDDFKELSTKETRDILESEWLGSNYSKRIWGDTEKLAKRLEELFTVEAMTGMSQQEMVRTIAKEFDSSIGVAKRLIRTESNYMGNQSKLKAWIDRGIEYYRLVVVLDFRTSSICQLKSKQNKRYKVAEAVVNGADGTYPPFHPWCRTIAIADFGERSLSGNRVANDPIGGKTFTIPQRATYEDWINKLRESYSDDEIAKHKEMILNRSKDNDDFRHLRNILGKEHSPASLDDFQEIKYNDDIGWDQLKKKVRLQKSLNNGDLSLEINQQKQDRHNLNHQSYADYLKDNFHKGLPAPSYFDCDNTQLQKIINDNYLSGVISNRNKGQLAVEIELKENILAYAYDRNGMHPTLTNRLKIHISKSRTHIVPMYPKGGALK